MPIALMTSFATDDAVAAHLAETPTTGADRVLAVAAPRLEPDGSLFRRCQTERVARTARVTATCSRRSGSSGTLDELVERGVGTISSRTSTTSAPASTRPIVGMHLARGNADDGRGRRKGGDTGGAPARVDGRPRLVEAIRFPRGSTRTRIPVFNTNTALIAVEALAGPSSSRGSS